MRYDFHTHTHYSDGVLSPEELIDRAVEKSVEWLAISDHDCVSALKQARDYVSQNGIAINIVDSIELTAQSDFGEIHIVGLNIDTENQSFIQLINLQQQKRWDRAEVFDDKFQKIGIDGLLNELKQSCKQVVTRSHVARALVSLGHVQDNNQAFKKYIGKKGRIKVKTEWVSMEDAIKAIADAGGVSVLAHPTRYPMSNRRLGYLIEEFKINGGDGIELSYPSLSPDKKAWIEVHREKNELLASGGSDFHYPDLKWSDLGRFPYIDPDIPHVFDLIKNKLQ